MTATDGLAAEAEAFDRRITERLEAGFVPDLRRARPCEHFYKSFWRHPHFIELYLGRLVEQFVAALRRHAPPGARVLDAGCGAGYVALELARHGYRVTGIDISPAAIAAARATAADNPFTDGFGSVDYDVCALADADGRYDAVLCSGVLHHMPDLDGAVRHLARLVGGGGVVLASEPTHERWRRADAAQVALIRAMLSVAGMWHEPDLGAALAGDDAALRAHIDAVLGEYRQERDADEPEGQSPHDNSATGEQIFTALDAMFERLECTPTVSFIYRLLGGLRGDDARVRAMAELLATYDRVATADRLMEANGRLYVGRRRQAR